MVQPVELAWEAVVDPSADLSLQIEQAFGPSGLGILTVSGVPNFAALRRGLLPQAAGFAALPPEVQKRYEDPESNFMFGWSRGVETLEGGEADLHKGSFYNNPLTDAPTCDPDAVQQYPTYCRPNIWPTAELPALEGAFKALGSLVIGIGLLLLHHCDKYVALTSGQPSQLRAVVQRSPCPKGRLLHYYPPCETETADAAAVKWCGWHTDHGSLTGLTPAIFLDSTGKEVPSPDPAAGLHIKTRSGSVVRAAIAEDHMAFQVGEVLQIQSGGALQATPHAVVGPRPALASGVSRNTFAVFMQPAWDELLTAPPGSGDVGIGQWEDGISFGRFTERTVNQYASNPGAATALG